MENERSLLLSMSKFLQVLVLLVLPFVVRGDVYWTSTTNKQSGQEHNTSIVQIDPMSGTFKPICPFNSNQFNEMPVFYDSTSKSIVFYDRNNWVLHYFTVKLTPLSPRLVSIFDNDSNQLQLPTCDQLLVPVKTVPLPHALTANNPNILRMYNEGNTNNLLVVSEYFPRTSKWSLGVFRFSLASSSVTLLRTFPVPQPIFSSSPFGPVAYDDEKNILSIISYRSAKPYPVVQLTTFSITSNMTKTVNVPLLINWNGGRLMSSIVSHEATQKIYGLWNIGTESDARLIAIDPDTGDYVEKWRSSQLADCYLGFEPNVNLNKNLLLLLCGDSRLTHLFYAQFVLPQNKFLPNPSFSLGNEVYPNTLVKVA